MERIQEALAKARKERADERPSGPVSEGPASQFPKSTDLRAESDKLEQPPRIEIEKTSHSQASPSGEGVAKTLPSPHSAVPDALWTGLPSLMVSRNRLVRARVLTYEAGPGAADFDIIRTRILQLQRTNGWRRIAVTSPTPSCGKSTLILNLAFSLSRQPDQRTIVFEMDFHRPSLARTLGIRQKHTLAPVLEGRAALADNAVRVGTNLIFATVSATVRNAAEIMQSSSARAAIEDIEARYQPTIMLFDTPPLLTGDDTAGFISGVDAVILVAAAEHTTIKQIDICERDIAGQTNVMGVILNKCRYMDRDTGYGQYGYD